MANSANTSTFDPVESGDAVDEVYEALSNERRRLVLTVLEEGTTPMDLPVLARRVARAETDREGGSVSGSTVERVTISLHHLHLPKLDDAGLVEYDAEDNAVVEVNDGAFDSRFA